MNKPWIVRNPLADAQPSLLENQTREWLRGYDNQETWASLQLAAKLLRAYLGEPAEGRVAP